MAKHTPPANAVSVDGTAPRIDVKVKTAAGLRRKLLCKLDTDEEHVQLAGDGEIHGLMGWLDEVIPKNGRVWDGESDPTAEDPAVLRAGMGKPIVGVLASGQSVKRGDLLVSAANGRVKKASTLAVAAGATAVTSSAVNGAIITGSAPPGGRIVGEAYHDVDATGGEKDITLLSHIAG